MISKRTLEIIEPTYSFGSISDEARWWYFEGFFWGSHSAEQEAELREAQLERTVGEMSATISALNRQLSAFRQDFKVGESDA